MFAFCSFLDPARPGFRRLTSTAARLARQIAEAFEGAHGKGVIHRDLKATELERHPEFRPRRPRVLFEGNFSLYAGADGPVFDIHPDGERFVLIRDVAPEPVPIEITLNWFTELERLVPTP